MSLSWLAAELASRLQDLAAKTPPGGWIIGHGYDDTNLDDTNLDDTNFGGHLSRQDLDRLVVDHPILLSMAGPPVPGEFPGISMKKDR